MQVAGGAFLGGPAGLTYFLAANFSSLENDRLVRRTLIGGGLLILALLVVLPLLPDWFPSAPFTFMYLLVGRHVADKYQMTKQAIEASDRYDFHSNWRVVGMGLLCMLGSLAIIIGPLWILAALGAWQP